MHNIYLLPQGVGLSRHTYPDLEIIGSDYLKKVSDPLFILENKPVETQQVCRLVHHDTHLLFEKESVHLLRHAKPKNEEIESMPDWIRKDISDRKVFQVNTSHPRWKQRLGLNSFPGKRIHLAGLGDVGSTLLTGLRLLGTNLIDHIGIFDLSPEKMQRWIHETNQISSVDYESYPKVIPINEDSLFDCDIFVFCIARQVPGLEAKNIDVRMAQFDANSTIIKSYARRARKSGFQGLFAVVSDPVDQLCQVVYRESNLDDNGNFDSNGLFPEQVKGYGLGVMNARAHFYASMNPEAHHFTKEGRVYGPHGTGLVVANSLKHYLESVSDWLTKKTLTANLAVREIGFKPYVAPALSSACLSLLATMKGEWHYSTVPLGGVYFGCLNRMQGLTSEWEINEFPDILFQHLEHTYSQLELFQC